MSYINKACFLVASSMSDVFTTDILSHVTQWLRDEDMQRLRLTRRRIKESVEAILKNPRVIVTLRPSQNTLTESNLQTLIKSELRNSARVQLDLSFCQIYALRPGYLLELTSVIKNLHSLILTKNPLKTEETWCLIEEVISTCSSLAKLDLSCTLIGMTQGANISGDRFAGVLHHCSFLTDLNLSGNRLTDEDLVAAMLPQMSALTKLNLENNYVGFGGLETLGRLAAVLPKMSALTQLNLAYNYVGISGAERLAGVLGQCFSLAVLDVAGNSMRNAGVEILAEVLPQMSALTQLNLANNSVGFEHSDKLHCVLKLSELLPQCSSLTNLNLESNHLSEGACNLAMMPGQCSLLTELNLRNNFIESDAAWQLIDNLDRFPALKVLNLTRNEIMDSFPHQINSARILC